MQWNVVFMSAGMEKGIKYRQDQSNIMLLFERNYRHNAVVLRVTLKKHNAHIFEHNVSNPSSDSSGRVNGPNWSLQCIYTLHYTFEARWRVFLPVALLRAALWCCRFASHASSIGFFVGNDFKKSHIDLGLPVVNSGDLHRGLPFGVRHTSRI